MDRGATGAARRRSRIAGSRHRIAALATLEGGGDEDSLLQSLRPTCMMGRRHQGGAALRCRAREGRCAGWRALRRSRGEAYPEHTLTTWGLAARGAACEAAGIAGSGSTSLPTVCVCNKPRLVTILCRADDHSVGHACMVRARERYSSGPRDTDSDREQRSLRRASFVWMCACACTCPQTIESYSIKYIIASSTNKLPVVATRRGRRVGRNAQTKAQASCLHAANAHPPPQAA